MQTVSFFSCRT